MSSVSAICPRHSSPVFGDPRMDFYEEYFVEDSSQSADAVETQSSQLKSAWIILKDRFIQERLASTNLTATGIDSINNSKTGITSQAVSYRLRQLSSLPFDWDSYGAVPPKAAALVTANNILFLIARSFGTPLMISARSDGGIIAEWRLRNGSLEVHIEPDGAVGYLLEDINTGTLEEADSVAVGLILKRMAQISGS